MDFFEQNVEYLAKSSNKDAIHDQIRKFYETSCDVQAKLLYATNYVFDHLDKIKNEDELFCFLSPIFDGEFPMEYTKIMKNVFYLLVFYMYIEGGDI